MMFVAVCHQTFEEVQLTKNLCYKLSFNIPKKQDKLRILSEQIESRNLRFTADGYFVINYSLITAVWTYMVSNLIISLTFKNK